MRRSSPVARHSSFADRLAFATSAAATVAAFVALIIFMWSSAT